MAASSGCDLLSGSMQLASSERVPGGAEPDREGTGERAPPPGQGWKLILDAQVHRKALELQQRKAAELKRKREAGEKLERRVAVDMLASDWFTPDKQTAHTRAYLLEGLLPTLLPGLEKLLTEAGNRQLLEERTPGGQAGAEQEFNPINYLAQHLMRNHPKICPSDPSHPYTRGLRQVLQQLKEEQVDLEDNRLVQLKLQVRETREERVRAERVRSQVGEMRKEALRAQFTEWSLEPDQTLQLRLVQNALRAFLEISSPDLSPDSSGVQYDRELDSTDDAQQTLKQEHFEEYVFSFIAGLPTDDFERFLLHLSLCAQDHRQEEHRERWRRPFSQLFQDCDCAKTGFLDRRRVLSTLEGFYDGCDESVRVTLHNPRSWPVRDPGELDSTIFWNGPSEAKEKEQEPAGETQEPSPPITASTETEPANGEEGAGEPGDPAGDEGRPPEERIEIEETDSDESEEGGLDLTTLGLGECCLSQLESQGRLHKVTVPADALPVCVCPLAEPDPESLGPHRGVSAFDHRAMDLPQFLQLLDTFLGEAAPDYVVQSLVGYLRVGYRETEQERLMRLEKTRKEAVLAQRRLALDALFEKCDNEGSGLLERGELERALSRYKEGAEGGAISRAWQCLGPPRPSLTRGDFHVLLQAVISELPPEGGQEGGFDRLLQFLGESAERSLAERSRGAKRRKWLLQIHRAALTGGASLEPVYRAVFQTLHRDAEAHGNNKLISASIALLEGNERLRYTACTAEDAPYVLNKELTRDMAKGVSFTAVDDGKPVHVPRVRLHGNVQFWNTLRPDEERKGSFVAVPLRDPCGRAIGVLGVDTLREPQERNIFLRHEIDFYQGVGNMFSLAFQHVLSLKNILCIVDSATSWLYSRAPSVRSVTTYLMEPAGETGSDYTLRKMMVLDSQTGRSRLLSSPASLRRRDHLFRDYLFKCCDSSEALSCVAYGEQRVAVPLRDPGGRALGVVDLSCGQQGALRPHERRDLQGMVRMVQAACCQLLRETSGLARPSRLLEAEGAGGEERVALLFLRFMLEDLRGCVRRLDHQSFAELKSYKDPPPVVHQVLRAVLLMLHPHGEETPEIDRWSQCRLKVNSDLVRKVLHFDPTARSVQVEREDLEACLAGIPRGEVWKHGSLPAEHLYNWVSVCLSLLEQAEKLRQSREPAPSNSDTLQKDPPPRQATGRNLMPPAAL
ncbi:EF-hand calcium-binding domain-containing protein 5-like isoform X3 [Acipenser ruthenus]|nr:EF-hand calcium-binding domain-containing protein 5-like isoform X3 [Acipenser ruthenus]XP_058856714.1 EF-hand calcium-binding domain-containing protein 5-like isoform X3 [Acipenser ruthenus]